MVEEDIKGEIFHAIHRYGEANNKYMKNYDKNKESLYLSYWNINNLCEWIMSQKLPLDGFKWVEEKSQFNEDFIEICNRDILLKLMFNIMQNCMNLIMVYLFCLKERKLKN